MATKIKTEQDEFFEYLRVQKLSPNDREWLERMEAAFSRQKMLTEKQRKIVDRLARAVGVEVDIEELFV